MIYGDPYNFAIQFDVVNDWNVPGDIWKNGVFAFYVNGENLFESLDVVELKTTLGFYLGLPLEDLDWGEFGSEVLDLYNHSVRYFSGECEILGKGLCSLTCTAMEDRSCYVFFQKCKEGDRFFWSVNNEQGVCQATLPLGTLKEVLGQISSVDL